jgi:hypothetical protein
MGSKRKRKRRQKAARAQSRLAKNPGVSSLLLVNPAPAPKKAAAPAPSPAPLTKKDLTSALAAAVKGRTMPQRAKKPNAVAKPKRRHNKKALRAQAHPKPAATHAAPTVQIINSPSGKTSLKPQIRRKRDGRTMPMDLSKQYKGLVPRKGKWRGKHERRGIKTLEAHKKSILWNLGKGSPGAQQWVLDHIPKLNPAVPIRLPSAEDAKDTGKEVLLGLAGFFGSRIAGNLANKLPVVSRMGAAGAVGASALTAGAAYFLLGKKWPALKKPLAVGGAIGVLDALIKNFVTPHVPSIGGVLGDVEPVLPQPKEQLALPPHSVGDSDDADGSDDAEDLHARSVAAHRMLGYDTEDDRADNDAHERWVRAQRQRGDDEANELAALREYVRQQRGMGFDVHPALAGCGYPPSDHGLGFDVHPAVADYEGGMGFDVHPAVADYEGGMGFDVHPAMADHEGGMGFDVHPAVADYEGGMGFDVHPAVAGVSDPESGMADDSGLALADSGDGLGMPTDEVQAGDDDVGHYISTGPVDYGRGAYEPQGTGAYVPMPMGTGAYVPAPPGLGAYLPRPTPMSGVDAEEIAAMLFGGPWAMAALNASRRRRRHRGRHPHHRGHRGRWHFDPRMRRWHYLPLGDSDDDAPEWTADEARRQRGVMGIDDMHGYGHQAHYSRYPRRHHPHHRHHGHHHQHHRPMHLECDFYLPHYEGYRHAGNHHPMHHPAPPKAHRPHHHPQNWHPMMHPMPMPAMPMPATPMHPMPMPAMPAAHVPPPAAPMQMMQTQAPTMARVQAPPPAHSEGFDPPLVLNAGGIFANG